MNTILVIAVWMLLAVVAAMRFRVTPRYSASERARLVAAHNEIAINETVSLEQEPLLESLHYSIRTLISVGFFTTAVVLFGVLMGTIIGTIGLLLLPLTYRLGFIGNLSDALRDRAMPYLLRLTKILHPLLTWFRDRTVHYDDIALNSQQELLELLERSPGVLSSTEVERLQASLAFDHKTVRDIMTPESMIASVDIKDGIGPLVMDELHKTGHSRFPVTDGDINHIVGMLYLHDLIDLRSSHTKVQDAMQKKVHFIHEGKDLQHALHAFLRTRHHLFIVVNDYRETVGLISLEDVIEALLGKKIVDEFDAFDDLRAVAESNPKNNNEPRGKKDI